MSVVAVSAADAAARLASFDAVIDARSPTEYAEDHLPGAQNWPVLDDDERHAVGFDYKQVSAFDARKRGAAMVARRIAEHIDAHLADKARDWQPLVYCWRGGQRSGTLAWFLGQIGFRVSVLQGGYKAFRALVREQLATRPLAFDYTVVAGRTGSGKTRLLQALRHEGAQVLDLEALARHRGSVLGGLPRQEPPRRAQGALPASGGDPSHGDEPGGLYEPQPTQRAFDTAVWHALQGFDPARPVFVESESRKIGQLQVPEALLDRMRRDSRVVMVTMPDAARIELLLGEYGFFADQPERFCAHMDTLVELRGLTTVTRWKEHARAGRWAEVFGELMREHYDPLYLRSMERNFAGVGQAQELALRDGGADALREAAAHLLAPR
ncbi:MAG TPA: tRNA 2-selenouridine(34) synthase MnmH [Burkholderiaceae bacterium]|nr:tRNA 2-selenouridine(34) synthase MnmH [Burkholderiaceae bacterium]